MPTTTPPRLIPVGTRLEPELREQLTAARTAAGRSEAQEIRQAILAWVKSQNAASN